ncbi:hypothetical protein IQ225_16490 [Synechocystis salina LEGE 06155]|nr:hypothetical protein [Synechocystis salina LEGE 06155]
MSRFTLLPEILICLLIKTQPCEQWNVGREFRRRVKQAFDKTDQGALN